MSDICLGPESVKSANGYLTDYHEEDVAALLRGGVYQDPTVYHQLASQVTFKQQTQSQSPIKIRFYYHLLLLNQLNSE